MKEIKSSHFTEEINRMLPVQNNTTIKNVLVLYAAAAGFIEFSV